MTRGALGMTRGADEPMDAESRCRILSRMGNGLLSKPVDLKFLRKVTAERVSFAFLALWCLLPAAMVGVCLWLGISQGYAFDAETTPYGPVYYQLFPLYRRAFLVLGSLTIAFALSQVAMCWKSIASIESVKAHPWFYLLAALLVWAVASTLLSDNPWLQFAGTQYRCDGLYSYFIYGSVLVCALRLHGERLRMCVLRLFVGVADALCIVMICQALHVPVIWQCFEAPYAVVFNNLNHFGYILCMASLCAMGLYLHDGTGKWGLAHIASFGLLVFTLLANDTFGCYLAVLVGMGAVGLFYVKSGHAWGTRLAMPLAVFAALSLVNLCGLMAPLNPHGLGASIFQLGTDVSAINDGSPEAGRAGSGRFKLWVAALQMIPERPIFGYGPEGLIGAYQARMNLDRPHNEIIQYAVFLGIPGLLLYLSALLSLAVQQWKRLKSLGSITLVAMGIVVGYVVSSLFGNTMFNTSPYFWMMLGFAAQGHNSAERLFTPQSVTRHGVVEKAVAIAVLVVCALAVMLLGIAL